MFYISYFFYIINIYSVSLLVLLKIGGEFMEKISYNKLGKFLLVFSIICSLIVTFLSFSGGNFIESLNNSSLSSSILRSITFTLVIFSGLNLKKKLPEYYKYQIISGAILLVTSLAIDIIPRIIYLT